MSENQDAKNSTTELRRGLCLLGMTFIAGWMMATVVFVATGHLT